MDVSTIISLSRKQTGTTTGQISDNDYLNYLNIIYKEIFSRLTVDSEKYTWQTFATDIIAGQSEYIIPQPDEDSTGLKTILDCYYKEKRIPIYDASININYEVGKNIPPYGVLRDGSIFIYPTPDENITKGLRLEGKYIPLDLTLATTSDEIKLAPEYHNVLVKGLNSLVFGEKQLFDKQQLWEGFYLEAIKQMQVEGSFDNESFYHTMDPYLDWLE